MRDREPIFERAVGRWRSILHQLGIEVPDRPMKQVPCPICAGETRFRFDDKDGRGTWICNKCGAGNGCDLVMKVLGVDWKGMCQAVERVLPSTVIVMPKRTRGVDPEIYRNLWRSSQPLSGNDPASWYLKARRIDLDTWPSQLRFAPRMTYRHEDGSKTQHPALLAMFLSPDASAFTIYATYLDATGRKANVPIAKRNAHLPVPSGGAVRLAQSAETMGVAPGVETALSAMMMHDIPVWATCNDGNLIKWQPPPTARNLIIFGDHDVSFSGQHAAYSLAYRLRNERQEGAPRFASVEVRIPGISVERDLEGTDWNDLRVAQASPLSREAAD